MSEEPRNSKLETRNSPGVSGILLAAGEGRRMGGGKLLLPFGETTVAGTALGALLESQLEEVIVVLGHQAKKLRHHLSSTFTNTSEASSEREVHPIRLVGKTLKFVVNSRYKEGMFTSVLCGLQAADPCAEALLVSLADHPGITSQVVNTLIAAFTHAEKGIVLPTYLGRRGHPLLFHRRYEGEVQRLDPSVGLRGLLSLHPDEVLEVPVDCPGVVTDIDCWEDYTAQRP